MEQNYGTSVPEVITDEVLFDYYNEISYGTLDPPISTTDIVPETYNNEVNIAIKNLLSKLSGQIKTDFQTKVNNHDIAFRPSTNLQGVWKGKVWKENGVVKCLFTFNPNIINELTCLALETILIHEMYHLYRACNFATTSNDSDHASMTTDVNYFNWLKQAFPGHTDNFYEDLRYAGTVISPVFTNLPDTEQDCYSKFFKNNSIY